MKDYVQTLKQKKRVKINNHIDHYFIKYFPKTSTYH